MRLDPVAPPLLRVPPGASSHDVAFGEGTRQMSKTAGGVKSSSRELRASVHVPNHLPRIAFSYFYSMVHKVIQ